MKKDVFRGQVVLLSYSAMKRCEIWMVLRAGIVTVMNSGHRLLQLSKDGGFLKVGWLFASKIKPTFFSFMRYKNPKKKKKYQQTLSAKTFFLFDDIRDIPQYSNPQRT